jgi:glyoxylase I family protein
VTIKVDSLTPLIQVFDMPTSVKFYREVLGFELIMQSSPGDYFDWGCLKLDETYLMLNTAYDKGLRPQAPDSPRVAAHNDTCLYFMADPDKVYEHLVAKGIEVKPPRVASYGMKQLYLSDPDNYGICFQCPVEAEA